MTPDDLARSCINSLKHPERSYRGIQVVGIEGSNKIPLPRNSFPKWRYIAFNAAGKPVYHYPAQEMLAALAYHGLINLGDYYEESTSRL